MSGPVGRQGGEECLARLAAEVERGEAHTVAVAFSDHYGQLRGRRLTAEAFVGGPDVAQAFCDGALVWDVRCEIFEATGFSNFTTGYPDCFARPDLGTLAPAAAAAGEYTVLCDVHDAAGEPAAVDPRRVLRRVAERVPAAITIGARLELQVPDEALAASWAAGRPTPFARRLLAGLGRAGLPVSGIGWTRPERLLYLQLAPRPPLEAADALILARGAAREVAAAEGVRLTAMPRRASGRRPALCRLTIEGAPSGRAADVAARLADLRLLTAPLPLAYPAAADAAETPAGTAVDAASDCNPYLAVAAALVGTCAAAPAAGGAGRATYEAAVERFAAAAWAADWFEPAFIADALALARREADLRAAAVTDWDLARYGDRG